MRILFLPGARKPANHCGHPESFPKTSFHPKLKRPPDVTWTTGIHVAEFKYMLVIRYSFY